MKSQENIHEQISNQGTDLIVEVYFTSSVTTSEWRYFNVHVLNLIKVVWETCEKLWTYWKDDKPVTRDSSNEAVKFNM